MNGTIKRLLSVVIVAALLCSLAVLPVSAADGEYKYVSVFDAETDAGPTTNSINSRVSVIDAEMSNEGSKVLKVTRTDASNGITASWTADYSDLAPQSLGIRVWVAGDENAFLLGNENNNSEGGVGFAFTSVSDSGTTTTLVDGIYKRVQKTVTTEGAWYTIIWDGYRFKSGGWVEGGLRVSGDSANNRTITADFLAGLQTVHLCFCGTGSSGFSRYINTSFYADDIQFIMDSSYNPVAKSDLSLDLNNSAIDVTVDGQVTDVTSTATEAVANGAAVTLTAKPAGNEFLFWTEDGKVRSENEQYSFLMNGARNVNAVFAPTTGSVVIYRNDTPDTKQVVATKTCETADDFTAHLVDSATMYDKTFTGWDKSVEEIQALIGSEQVIYVNSVYRNLFGSYSVTVENGRIDGNLTIGNIYSTGHKLNITTDLEGFSYWTDDTGAVLSTSATFIYTVTNRDAVLTAVANATPAASSTLTVEYDGDLMKIYHSFYLPDDCKLIDAGLIYAKSLLNTEPVLADVDGTTVKATHLGAAGGNAQTIMNTITSASGVTLRGYVIYEIGGETVTIYSATDNGGV